MSCSAATQEIMAKNSEEKETLLLKTIFIYLNFVIS